jgi:hypothetical protein
VSAIASRPFGTVMTALVVARRTWESSTPAALLNAKGRIALHDEYADEVDP